MRKKTITPVTQARWERWLAAGTSLTLMVTPPVTAVIGFIEYVFAAKRHPLFAKHGLHLALWNLFIALLEVDIYFTTSFFPIGKIWKELYDALTQPVVAASRADLATIFAPVRQVWAAASFGEHFIIILFEIALVWNFLVMILSIVSVLRRRNFVAPVIGWLLQKDAPDAVRASRKK